MKKLALLLLILLSLININKVNATHILGSDITWRCVGQDSFLVKLVVYRDCNEIYITPTPITFKCAATGTTITSLTIGLGYPIDITPVCNSSCSRCTSSSCSFPYGIHKFTMQGIVRLSGAGSCCSIILSWLQGYRSSAITTGSGAGYDFYIDAKLNRCQNPCDNSPTFTNDPISIICVGQDFTFNHGVQDIDVKNTGGLSDSLTYEWAEPLQAANAPIPYITPYAYNKPINFWGFPNNALPLPRGIHLNPNTGDIQFQPTKPEVTVMVVQVNEFRNGVKIAEIKRDMTIFVISCMGNKPPTLNTPNNVRSKNVCAGDQVTFNFTTSDSNANDSVTISWNNALPGAIWTTTNGQSKNPTATLTWTPTSSQVGSLPYFFAVTAKDNSCPLKGQFTQSYQIRVYPVPKANISISDSGCGKYYFKALPIIGSSPTYKWSSDSFTFSPNTGSLVSHTFLTGNYPIKLVMTTLGCSKNFYDTAIVVPFMSVSLPADTAVCINSTISIQASVVNAASPYKLKWGSGNVTFPGDTTLTKQIIITKDTSIWIRATSGSFNCPFDEITIKVHPVYKISLPEDTVLCGFNNIITPAFSTNISAFRSFKWFKQGSSVVVDTDASLNVYDTGNYICVATDTFDCSSSDSVRVHVNPLPVIKINPIDKRCINGTIISLNNFVTVDGVFKTGGIWTSQSAGLIYGDKFNPVAAGVSTPPGWKVKYEYINPVTGCYNKDSGYVTINALPKPFAGADDSICTGAPMALAGVPNSLLGAWRGTGVEGSYPNWRFNPDAAGIINGGTYEAIYHYIDNNQCENEDTVRITVFSTPNVDAGNPKEFCEDMSPFTLTGSPAGGKWTGMGVTGNQFYPSLASTGVHVMTYTYSNVICSVYDQVNYTVYPKTSTPVISFTPSDSFLECNMTNGSYKWNYRPDTFTAPITISINSRRINPHLYCNKCYFSVVYTDINGCASDTSAFYHYVVNSVDKSTGGVQFVIYPNPAHSQLFIENPENEPVTLILSDIYGKSLSQQKLLHGKNTFNISFLKPGIYILRLNDLYKYRLIVE